MRHNKLFLSILFFVNIPNCFANDTAFGGSGALPMPIKKTDVALLAEQIVINGHEIAREDMQGNWEYNCDYIFKNLSNNALSFQMGFPFPVNDELGETTIPQGFTRSKNSPLVYNFVVNINGKNTQVANYKMTAMPDKDMTYEDAFIWNMTIAPNATVNIHHHYLTGVTVNAMGQYYVTFVLKTGGLWAGGTIGETKIEVTPNTPTRLCSELDKTADYLQVKPSGVQIIGDKNARKYIWDLKNFNPTDDLALCLMTSKNYVRYFIINPILQGGGYNNIPTDLNQLSSAQLRILRNTIYAQYGRTFVDADLQKYFDNTWWYQRNPNYNDRLLTADDKKALAKIMQVEAAKK